MKAQEADPVFQSKLFYDEYIVLLLETETLFIQTLTQLKETYAKTNRRFPVEHYKTRIKTADSAKAKLKRLGLPQTLTAAQNSLFDLVGARIVCRFIDDIYEIKQALQQTDGIEITHIKDYIKNPKPNGYRSLHMIMRLPLHNESGVHTQYVEVQMRTIAMDFWASLEHELKYKQNVPDADLIFSELKRCADEISSVDLSMQTIYEWIHKSN